MDRIFTGARGKRIARNVLHPCQCRSRREWVPLGGSARFASPITRPRYVTTPPLDVPRSYRLFYSLTVFSRRASNEDMRPGKEPTLIRDWLLLDARRIALSISLPVLSHTSIVNSSRCFRLVFIGDVPSPSSNLIFPHLALQVPYCSHVLQKHERCIEKLIHPSSERDY